MLADILLFPYSLILRFRHFLYDKGIKKVHSAEVPTICIGNITVGGTGKTPQTEMILRLLQQDPATKGLSPAVLSRGYKRRSRGFQQIPSDAGASFSGDEPLQIKKKFPAVTVAVDSDRVEGCCLLAHPEKIKENKKLSKRCKYPDFPAADIILLDDAYQYRKLKATLNIVLVDYNRPVYKDHLLPFGRLRDIPSRLADADIIIVTKCPHELDNWERTTVAHTLGLPNYATSSCTGRNAKGRTQHVFFTRIAYETPVPLFPDSDPRYIYAGKLILFTGIANDSALRAYLSDSYKIVKRFSFSDHHKFTGSDFRSIRHAADKYPTAALGTTEKDAQRVLDSKKVPPALRKKMFQVPIRAEFLSEKEQELFLGLVRAII